MTQLARGAARRTLDIPPFLADMLAEHLAARRLTGTDADALVFVSPEGGPLRTHCRSRVCAPAIKKAGLPGLTFPWSATPLSDS